MLNQPPMLPQPGRQPVPRRGPGGGFGVGNALLVVGLALLVYWQPAAAGAQTVAAPPAAGAPAASPILPAPVLEMRELILAAVRSGGIADLREAVAWNELPPSAGQPAGVTPIEHWLLATGDPGGRALLALLGHLLAGEPRLIQRPNGAGPPAPQGRNPGKPGKSGQGVGGTAGLYVWPAAAESQPAHWTPAEIAELGRWLTAADIAGMQTAGRYNSWRLGIGADGTWHFLEKLP